MNETSATIAGLRTIVVTPDATATLIVVVLHGYAMTPEDLAPFAHSLGLSARFYVPEGPIALQAGRAWWDRDGEARARALALGPRDLSGEHPVDAVMARARLMAFLDAVRNDAPELPLALVGFSQGGMLACDAVLRDRRHIAALALLSSSRIAADEWEPLADSLRGLPVLLTHGRADTELAFSAGEALRDFMMRARAQLTWVPFDQGHEVPLVVWRNLRKFLLTLS